VFGTLSAGSFGPMLVDNVTQTVTVNSSLSVVGPVAMADTLSIASLVAGGAMMDLLYVGHSLSVGGAITQDGTLDVGGNLTMNGILTVASAVIMGDTLSVAGNVTVDGALSAGSLSLSSMDVSGQIKTGTVESASDITTSGSVSCREDANARIDLCSVSDGSSRGPSIDATAGGSTKFHVGGVLKVKVSDAGVAIFGSTSFTGAAVFNGNATFNGQMFVNGAASFTNTVQMNTLQVDGTSNFYNTALFNETTHHADQAVFGSGSQLMMTDGSMMSMQSGSDLYMQSGSELRINDGGVAKLSSGATATLESGSTLDVGLGSSVKLAYGTNTTSTSDITSPYISSTTINALSGKIMSGKVLSNGDVEIVTMYNSQVNSQSLSYVTAEDCGATSGEPLSVSATSANNQVLLRVRSSTATCTTGWRVNFVVFQGPV